MCNRAAVRSTGGSTLIWALVAALVLLILVGTLATVVTFSSRQTATSQVNTQAYYTARSVSERLTSWLSGTPDNNGSSLSEQQLFIANLANGPIHQSYSEADLGGDMGTAEADISINAKLDLITIVATGFVADQEETITTTLALKGTYSGGDNPTIRFPDNTVSFFEDDPNGLPYYEGREVELNGKPRDSFPTIVGNEAATADNQNSLDTTKAKEVTGDEELTYRRITEAANTVLGTNRFVGAGEAANTSVSTRKFIVPPNGRWVINPLLKGNGGGVKLNGYHANSATAENNTRPIMLAIGDYNARDLHMRLGGMDVSTQPVLSRLVNDKDFYNSLIAFDVTDNAGNTTENPFIEYYDNNRFANTPQNLWHQQNWTSMTVYTQDPGSAQDAATVNGGVDTRLVFGPFLHSYNEYGDYWSWGRYIGNPWYGQTAGDYWKAFPGNNYTSGVDKRLGMAHIPEYYGNDMQFFFLDAINKPALFIQGVNILDQNTNSTPSAIYSRRGVEIGGALVKTTSKYDDDLGQTTRHVNSAIYGYSFGYAPVWPSYFPITTRYSQILYNTDIVLRTPNGTSTPRQSRIFDASLPTDGAYGEINAEHDLQDNARKKTVLGVTGSKTTNNFSDDYNKQFTPTVRIIGGDIYVGAGQTLTIDGGRINTSATATKYPGTSGRLTFEGRTVTVGTANGEYTQVVAPDSITVAAGGTLVVRGRHEEEVVEVTKNVKEVVTTWTGASEYANVNAPIYVEGTLNLEEGAWLTNQVFCYGGGVVNVKNTSTTETVTWERRAGEDGDQDGINVFDGGTLNVEENASITLKGARIYVSTDRASGSGVGTMNIGANSTIAGDVAVRGTLNIIANFTLNVDPAGYIDDPLTPNTNESLPGTHGIFIYDEAILNINNGVTRVAGNSGRIHCFGGYAAISDITKANAIFCNDRDPNDNTCRHWFSNIGAWVPQDLLLDEGDPGGGA
jgi:hypothetical protein